MEDETRKKWGTHLMGYPAVPTVHPDNQKAATWNAGDHHHPYLIYSPLDKPPTNNPLDPLVRKFHAWTTQAETLAQNIWHNLKTGPSVSEAAWGKVNLTAKAIQEGGFESLYKQVFEPFPNDTLKKTFACYLATTTGPVAGTLYLSTHRVAFASDRPLSFTAPSGQQTWSYYKVLIPWADIATVNPVILRENPSEKYIHVLTVDGHEFWFMGFVNFDKASYHLANSLAVLKTTGQGFPSTFPTAY